MKVQQKKEIKSGMKRIGIYLLIILPVFIGLAVLFNYVLKIQNRFLVIFMLVLIGCVIVFVIEVFRLKRKDKKDAENAKNPKPKKHDPYAD